MDKELLRARARFWTGVFLNVLIVCAGTWLLSDAIGGRGAVGALLLACYVRVGR